MNGMSSFQKVGFLHYLLGGVPILILLVSVSLIKEISLVAVKSNGGAIVAVWAPIIVVSFDYNVYKFF